jgi:hypothetical protein
MTLKSRISNWMLNVAEKLPSFNGGLISHLQTIRAIQRKSAKTDLERRLKPDGGIVALTHINVTIPFELEDFESIHRGLRNLFGKNEKNIQFIKKLKDEVNSFSKTSWNNLGSISSDPSRMFVGSNIHIADELPSSTDYVRVSYLRLLPSVAAIEFSFSIKKAFSSNLDRIQAIPHLDPIEFTRLFPLSKIRRGHSSVSTNGAATAISNEIEKLYSELSEYIGKRFFRKKVKALSNPYLFTNIFKLFGAPNEDQFQWIKINHSWLNDYSLNPLTLDYSAEQTCYWIAQKERSSNRRTSALLFTDLDEMHIDFSGYALSIVNSLVNMGDQYQLLIEKLHHAGFKNLSRNKKRCVPKMKLAQELKIMLTTLNRFEHELKKSNHTATSLMDEIGALNDRSGNPSHLAENIIKGALFRADRLKNSIEILDSGLSRFIEIRNISLMQRLQWIALIIALIAIPVAFICGWEDVKCFYTDAKQFFNVQGNNNDRK